MTATFTYADSYGLDPNSDRVQLMDDGFLWHRSHPACYIMLENKDGQFVTGDGQPTGEYYLFADRMTGSAPEYGDEFWLVPVAGRFDVDSYSETDPDDPTAEHVPWGHIVQHLYDCFTDFDIKEAHTFWPVGTTEVEVLTFLVEALNNGNYSSRAGATVRRDGGVIKTFFLDKPINPEDKFTGAQMSDLSDMLS
jgi:hypothetical protein